MRILLASDHWGVRLKKRLAANLGKEHQTEDLGPVSDDRVDYPDFAAKLAREVAKDPQALGILICGSGIGMSISANKHPGIRAAVVENPVAARLTREHNDANVLCLGTYFLGDDYAEEIARVFIATPFSNDARHVARVAKIKQAEAK
jgi:ribose 5-phosphate isomerase B